jgi:hypothetical protein
VADETSLADVNAYVVCGADATEVDWFVVGSATSV